MFDFLRISTRSSKQGIEIYPKFRICKSSDLMIRGGDFYAIWLEDRGMWSTDEQDVLDRIDYELDKYAKDNKELFGERPRVLHVRDSETRFIGAWHQFCQRDMRDSYHMLDEKLIFSNMPTSKKDYASKRLPYPLEQGSHDAYDRLMSVLYSPEERMKIEWAIGSIVSGDSKRLQKFMVLQGLNDLAAAFQKFSEMSWDEISRGLSAMGGALGEVALGGILNTLSGLGALSISTIAEPLGILADSVKKWTDVVIPDGLTLQLAALAAGISAFTFSGIGALSLSAAAEPLGILADSVKKWTGVTVPDGLIEKMATLAASIEKFTFAGIGADALSASAPGVGAMADAVKKWETLTIPDGLEDGLTQIANGIKAFSFAFLGGWSLGAITEPIGELATSVRKWRSVSILDDLEDGLKRIADGIKAFSWAFLGGWSLGAIIDPLSDLADAVKKWNGVSIPADLGAGAPLLRAGRPGHGDRSFRRRHHRVHEDHHLPHGDQRTPDPRR